MIHLLIDTSVLIKWFHAEGETELAEARALRSAHASGGLEAHIIDLALYELGNVLIRALHWRPAAAADQLDDLLAIVGPPLSMSPEWLRRAATLAYEHELSFYDASCAAASRELRIPLVSADRELQGAGLAESPGDICVRLGISTVGLTTAGPRRDRPFGP
jgi:predicted nucleic acid-binding protein